MKIRNKAGTWWRLNGDVPPGGTFTVPEHEAHDLVKKYPNNLELVPVGGRDGVVPERASAGGPSHGAPPASPKAHESEPAPAPKKKRGWKGR